MLSGCIIVTFQVIGSPTILFQQICSQLFCFVHCFIVICLRIYANLNIDRVTVRDAVPSFSVAYSPSTITMLQRLIDIRRIYIIVNCTSKISILHCKSMRSGISSFTPVVCFVNNHISRFILANVTILFADHLFNVYFHCVLLFCCFRCC